MPTVFGTYDSPAKDTLKLIHGLCDLHSHLHLHLHDAADRCAARHYWVRQTSNSLQCTNTRQLHHLAAVLPWSARAQKKQTHKASFSLEEKDCETTSKLRNLRESGAFPGRALIYEHPHMMIFLCDFLASF